MARACTDPGCSGTFEGGFCDTCGRAEPAGAGGVADLARASVTSHAISAIAEAMQPSRSTGLPNGGVGSLASASAAPRGTGRVVGARRPSASRGTAATGGTTGTSASSRSARAGGSRGSTSRRHALGGGLVQLPTEPSQDPLLLVMAEPRVPDGKAVCPACGNRVNPDKRFCSNCGAEYDFRPALRAGDVLADQYEVKGPIAFGGLGWIYLAMDTSLNRWVVLKGLLNSKDAAAAAAAVAERQFLAAVKHGKIVGIYTFLTRGAESYIVMEYVGGRTLKTIRRARGPLPPAEAMAIIAGILPAFAYLHERGLVYCDFKPDNAMLEGDDVKLIDLGAVRRIDDPSGDIYGTVGYKAPEADDEPSVASDLFTVGRTLAALLMDFDLTGHYVAELPPPNALLHTVPESVPRDAGIDPAESLRASLADGGGLPPWLRWSPGSRTFSGSAPAGTTEIAVRLTDGGGRSVPVTLALPLAVNESLHRFLLKATAAAPEARFQSAEDMASRLITVLRETVARDGPIPAVDSAVFLGERLAPGDPMVLDGAWRRLPMPRMVATDPASAELFAAGMAAPAARELLLSRAVGAHRDSPEARLRLANLLIEGDSPDADKIMALLDEALALDPGDWRPDWYCGRLYMSLGRADEAVECFDKIYGEEPGEPAPKLALAMALEAAGRSEEAAGYYRVVCRTDTSLSVAAFGLARCLATAGDRDGAVAALAGVPDNAALAVEARLAAVRILSAGDPDEPALRQAAEILVNLKQEAIARYEAEASVAEMAARKAGASALSTNGELLLGVPPTEKALRHRAELALRACARLSETDGARVAYVDRANAVRPRTWL
jgi:serine/threonine-protein kinase PknG